MNHYFPHVSAKTAPRDIKCGDCGAIITKGRRYFRHNHGNYCPKCSAQYSGK